jgi:broad specificity phosphatase PhoE
MAKIYIVRHGTTALNSEDKLRGWIDTPLNRQGRKEAINLGNYFKDKPISLIYSSDLKRSMSTSQEINRTTGAQIVPLASLRPLNYGSLNGQKLSEIHEKLDELSDRWKKTPDVKAPGGESFSSFQDRHQAVFESILKNLKSEDNIVISGHLRTANYLVGYIKNNRQPLSGDNVDHIHNDIQEPAAVSILNYDPKKDKVTIEKLNYTDHFEK